MTAPGLPADKADHVIALQKEGRKVCFVGDGHQRLDALKQANALISPGSVDDRYRHSPYRASRKGSVSATCAISPATSIANVRRSWG